MCYNIFRVRNMNITEIKAFLKKKSEPDFQKFSVKLINNSSLPLLGVRLPELRKLAAQIHKSGESSDFLDKCDFSSIEMCQLYAFVLGKEKGDINDLLVLFDKAAAHVDNWAVCDVLCQSFGQCEKHRAEVWAKLEAYLATGKTYYMRIAVVTMLSHYLTDEYIDRVLKVISETKNEDYYYKMGAAWAAATALAKFPEKTFEFFRNCGLDDWTYNKAIQKMIESRRVSEETKAALRAIKRTAVKA